MRHAFSVFSCSKKTTLAAKDCQSARRRVLMRDQSAGFTLIELMMVVAILGTLAAIAMISSVSHYERARLTRAIVEIHMLEKEIISFQLAYNRLPDTLAEAGWGLLNDPWGNPYQYLSFANIKGKGKMRKDHAMVPVNTDFDLYSMGPDGQTNGPFSAPVSRDDIVRAYDGAYVGPVSRI